MSQLRRQAARGAAWVLGNSGMAGLINFLALIWFARTLGVVEIGRFAVLVVAIDLILGMLGFGFNRVVIRAKNVPMLFDGALALILFQSAAFIVVSGVFFVGHFFFKFDGAGFYLAGLILVLGRTFGLFANLVWSPIEADLRYKPLSVARLIATIAAIGVAIAFVLAGTGIIGLAVRDIVYPLVLLIALRIYCWRRLVPNFGKEAIRPVWRFSRGVWALNFLERFAVRLDYALVGGVLGVELLGIYFQVRALMEGVLGFIVTPIQTVLYSFYCQRQALLEGEWRNVQRWAIGVLVGAVLSVAIAVEIGEELMLRLLGPEWVPGASLLGGFAVYFWAVIYFENLKSLAMAQTIHARATWGRVAQILIISVLMIPLANAMGLAGAGLVTGLAAFSLATIATLTVFHARRSIPA